MKNCFIACQRFKDSRGKIVKEEGVHYMVDHKHPVLNGIEFSSVRDIITVCIDYKRDYPKGEVIGEVIVVNILEFN